MNRIGLIFGFFMPFRVLFEHFCGDGWMGNPKVKKLQWTAMALKFDRLLRIRQIEILL